jgi:hypothetical protein
MNLQCSTGRAFWIGSDRSPVLLLSLMPVDRFQDSWMAARDRHVALLVLLLRLGDDHRGLTLLLNDRPKHTADR